MRPLPAPRIQGAQSPPRRRPRAVALGGAAVLALGLLVVDTEAAGADEPILSTDFSSGTTEGWFSRGDVVVEATAEEHLLVEGRTETWHGAAIDITDHIEVGSRYRLSVDMKLPEGADPAQLRTTVQRDVGTESSYDSVVFNREVGGDAWIEFTGAYSIAAPADSLHFYVESDQSLTPILVDDFSLTRLDDPEIEDLTPLKDVLADDFVMGTAVEPPEVTGKPSELLAKHFAQLTVGNQMKPEAIQPVEGVFDFSEADRIVDFAEAAGMRIWGHTLLWHNQTPNWWFEDANGEPLTGTPEDRALMIARLESHINAIADHYGDRIWAWDVVNEVVDPSEADGLRHSRWYEIFGGGDYIAHAFTIAREAFGPDVKLFINDYNTEFPDKRNAMYDLVESMRADGVPIEGVGHQAHVSLDRPVELLGESIDAFAGLGVLQAVTELDVSISRHAEESLPETPPERLVEQGWYYRDLFEVLRARADKLESVTVWGLYDAVSWLRTWPIDRPHEAPLIFDDDLQSKPAYWGIVDPSRLDHFAPAQRAARAAVEVDGFSETEWSLVPGGDFGTGAFQTRWDEEHLYLLARLEGGERLDVFVNDSGERAGEWTEGDAAYAVARDGTASEGIEAVVAEDGGGWLVEAAIPLATPGATGRSIGFDLRVADGGILQSWSDPDHAQETDTSRFGAVELTEAIAAVEVREAKWFMKPVIDGRIDWAWWTAPCIETEVDVVGADGARARVRLLWDDTYLYALFAVDDAELDESSPDVWAHDSVELFVNPGNTKSGAYGPLDGQYRVSFSGTESLNTGTAAGALTSAAATTATGYLVEMAVALPEGFGTGSMLGLDAQVNDAADGARTGVTTWHDPTGDSWQNTSRWGVAMLD
ncbi:endo-1,4-beta-xylanase [Glycomyces sp. L485]|uniref:endo-1,4-beta-xylanase n=1 Tax=Glycomyces sp. L485 TaxID=2909235 RepID=UPI001F4B8F57|nr:endo-1,4-beta-xylanase [Glycomyces sp. L485]MCH7230974.1 endo-1,4-beta-xylanase [Glycomyces sp. L485]